jgi:hypothetical protein
MHLKDETTGEVERSENYQQLFTNLNRSGHNYLRITRVLKCLGEFGFEHLKRPWIEFMINEIFVEGSLSNCKDSCKDYWVPVMRDDEERARLIAQIHEFMPPPQEEDEVRGGRGAKMSGREAKEILDRESELR